MRIMYGEESITIRRVMTALDEEDGSLRGLHQDKEWNSSVCYNRRIMLCVLPSKSRLDDRFIDKSVLAVVKVAAPGRALTPDLKFGP